MHLGRSEATHESGQTWVRFCRCPHSVYRSKFTGPTFTFEDDRFAYGEQRFITLGLLRGRVVVIAHTEHDDEVHIISMREGTKREQTTYFRSLTD